MMYIPVVVLLTFSAFMRGLGGFFIRRKLDRVSGRKDYVYRAVLQTVGGDIPCIELYYVEILSDGLSI